MSVGILISVAHFIKMVCYLLEAEHKVSRDYKASRDYKDFKVSRDYKDFKVSKEYKD